MQRPVGMTKTAAAATDLIVGIGAGLVAAWAMNAFQSGWMKLSGESEPKETAASKAADALSDEISGSPVKQVKKKAADSVVHYLTAAIMGGAYGLIGGRFPRLFMGNGLLFGGLIWAAADELAVPALHLSPPPSKMDFNDHSLGLCSHLVFGAVLDLVRRQTNLLISPPPTAP
jgi:putative membrane protein